MKAESINDDLLSDERLGYCAPDGLVNGVSISHFSSESAIKTYNGMERGDYVKTYLSHIRKFHFHDTGCRSPFASECHAQNDGYYLYANGGNLSAILFRIFNEYPLIYRRIVKVIRSVTPYFGDLVRCFMVILSRWILASGK